MSKARTRTSGDYSKQIVAASGKLDADSRSLQGSKEARDKALKARAAARQERRADVKELGRDVRGRNAAAKDARVTATAHHEARQAVQDSRLSLEASERKLGQLQRREERIAGSDLPEPAKGQRADQARQDVASQQATVDARKATVTALEAAEQAAGQANAAATATRDAKTAEIKGDRQEIREDSAAVAAANRDVRQASTEVQKGERQVAGGEARLQASWRGWARTFLREEAPGGGTLPATLPPARQGSEHLVRQVEAATAKVAASQADLASHVTKRAELAAAQGGANAKLARDQAALDARTQGLDGATRDLEAARGAESAATENVRRTNAELEKAKRNLDIRQKQLATSKELLATNLEKHGPRNWRTRHWQDAVTKRTAGVSQQQETVGQKEQVYVAAWKDGVTAAESLRQAEAAHDGARKARDEAAASVAGDQGRSADLTAASAEVDGRIEAARGQVAADERQLRSSWRSWAADFLHRAPGEATEEEAA